MDKFEQRFREKLNKNHRYFVFPTEKTKDEEIATVVDKVKEIVSSYTTEAVTEAVTETTSFWTTQEAEPPTTIHQEIDSNSTISEILTDSNRTIMEVLNNSNRTVAEVLNNGTNAVFDVMTGSNRTTLFDDAGDNSTSFEVTPGDNSTSTERHKLFDWMDSDPSHNLTMVHAGLPEMKPDGDQTVFIILGVVLGMLVAVSFVLLLVYVSYKRSNFYTLQERASSQHSSQHRAIPLQVSSDQDSERDGSCSTVSGYKF